MNNVVVALVLLSISVCSGVSPAHADVKDVGEVCISFSYDNVGFPPVTRAYGALVYGARQQYIVLTATAGLEHGFAVVTGDQIVVALTATSVSPDASTIFVSTSQMTLSASTLRGPLTTSGKLTGTASVLLCN